MLDIRYKATERMRIIKCYTDLNYLKVYTLYMTYMVFDPITAL
jgi:hypothetical protein